MTHPLDFTGGLPAANGGAVGRGLRLILAELRARLARARAEAARRETLRLLESLGPDRLHDVGLRDGDVRRLRRGDPL